MSDVSRAERRAVGGGMRGRRRNRRNSGARHARKRAMYISEHRRSPVRAIDVDQRSVKSCRFARTDWCVFVANA
ncbi:hypothetical protein WG70_06460 [Burkholderia oklahomensis EO147]|nr:hypothetical protein WG70_06460 [Burkholderia oklahomensis EO147]AOI48985.1 hypothetical protein WI23_24585 [Burkholderia oklahomensis C6786]KUY47895.1 hypothetical protein WG70_22365 [Burkholderia oklahomensis EO147]KUY61111.1 hypothetical protein WI23_12775 [Burkholderia oklahomensis C6786]